VFIHIYLFSDINRRLFIGKNPNLIIKIENSFIELIML